MATWPTALPPPLVSGYKVSPVDPVVRTDFEVGAARARRRTAARQDRVDVSWAFSDAEFEIFRDWFDDGVSGVAGGSAWFDVSLRIGNGGSTAQEARFTGAFSATAVGGQRWTVTATLEIR